MLLSDHLESVVLTRLRDEVAEVEPIPAEQFGFRAGLSTDIQLFQIAEAIRDGLTRRERLVRYFWI